MYKKFYTGVGSRQTPPFVQDVMTSIAAVLTSENWILRSGGADGADTAFEKGVRANHLKEIYVPWIGYNDRMTYNDILGDSPEAFKIAQSIHPAWFRMKKGGQKLHARNAHEVLGRDLNTPSRFLVCWTPGGRPVGGTRTAIILAQQCEIPVFNLGEYDSLHLFKCVEQILRLTKE